MSNPNTIIVEALMQAAKNESYEGQNGDFVITLENLRNLLCRSYNCDARDITVPTNIKDDPHFYD